MPYYRKGQIIMKNNKVKKVCLSGLMAAMVFVFTFTFKIPIGPLGYAHLGDAFIILAVWILGGKQAWFPAALGAALADFTAGYVMWIVPTAIVKALMAVTIFLVAEKLMESKTIGYVIGIAAGAVVHIAGYCVAWYIIGGKAGLTGAIVPLVLQTVIGAVLGAVLISVLNSTGAGKKLKSMAQ